MEYQSFSIDEAERFREKCKKAIEKLIDFYGKNGDLLQKMNLLMFFTKEAEISGLSFEDFKKIHFSFSIISYDRKSKTKIEVDQFCIPTFMIEELILDNSTSIRETIESLEKKKELLFDERVKEVYRIDTEINKIRATCPHKNSLTILSPKDEKDGVINISLTFGLNIRCEDCGKELYLCDGDPSFEYYLRKIELLYGKVNFYV